MDIRAFATGPCARPRSRLAERPRICARRAVVRGIGAQPMECEEMARTCGEALACVRIADDYRPLPKCTSEADRFSDVENV
jgi:hypothetical protein